ncbi:MAG: hypothetical protein ACO1QB_03580 [Verrucomicrobiales bacterium]
MNAVSTKRKALFYLIGTFLAGLLAGGIGGYQFAKWRPFPRHTPEQMAEYMMKGLKEELNLSASQVEKSRPILLDTAIKVQQSFRETGAAVDRHFEANNQKLSEFLTPNQVERLNQMEERRKNYFK